MNVQEGIGIEGKEDTERQRKATGGNKRKDNDRKGRGGTVIK